MFSKAPAPVKAGPLEPSLIVKKQAEISPETLAKLIEIHLREVLNDNSIMIVPSQVFAKRADNNDRLARINVHWEQKVYKK